MATWTAEQRGFSLPWFDSQVLRLLPHAVCHCLHQQAQAATRGAPNRTAPPHSSLFLCWLLGQKKYDFGINFMSQRSRSYVVPFLKRIVRHSYTFPAMLSCPLPAPSLMQFQANINQFRELHWAKKITTFYRVIILLVLTLQAGMLMDNISAMPRAKDHPLPSTSNHLEQTIKP